MPILAYKKPIGKGFKMVYDWICLQGKEVGVKKKVTLLLLVVALGLFFTACSTVRVDRVRATKNIDLSGEWNDTDIRQVSETLTKSALKGSWFSTFSKANKRNPVVIVGRFTNMSSERIDTSIITKKMESALIESGKIVLVSDSAEREFIRDERSDQQIYADPKTTKALAMETGADFMLLGSVKTVVDSEKNRSVKTYYVSAQLVDLESTRVVWLDESTIKKVISRSPFSW